jgi:hypothetical protein
VAAVWRMARTALFGPTMTASRGSTRRHPDGPMWPRFKQAATRRTWSGVGPDLTDMGMLWIKLGPLQAVRVEPAQAVLTRRGTTPLADGKAEAPVTSAQAADPRHAGGTVLTLLACWARRGAEAGRLAV